ncbi:hypothetical protein AB0K12_20820 [Nonomuraea sp. NPDC049419]|uniref:hypothetical protein n=1 Tax=Nonomuraea sp. NPDC049419 TaxID=3155772 RepID=UPI003435C5CD
MVLGRDADAWRLFCGDELCGEITIDEVAAAVSLVSPCGPVAEFLLHIEGDRAWFRT